MPWWPFIPWYDWVHSDCKLNTETHTAPQPKESSRSRQSFNLLSQGVCHWASPNPSSHLQQVPQPRHRTWRLATCRIQPTTDQCRSPVFVASCKNIVSSAILSNTLKLTTFSLIVSMGLGPGGAVKHHSPSWTLLIAGQRYSNRHDHFRFLKSLWSNSPPSPPQENSSLRYSGKHTQIDWVLSLQPLSTSSRRG